MNSRLNLLWLTLSLFLPLPEAKAGGKHLEIMAPLARQNDLKGKPHKVTERSFESEDGGAGKLESVKQSEYDNDGNPLRIETFDSANRKTDFEIYGYDAERTWISLTERSEGTETAYRIFVDLKTRRIAKVDARSNKTEFISYTERGFEAGAVTQNGAGKVVEKTTLTRSANDKEERVVFEEPAGTTTTEISIRWTAEGFEDVSTMIFHDKGGDKIVSTFEYPETDSIGNWLTQIEKPVLHRKDGERVPLPTVTVKRTIVYHP